MAELTEALKLAQKALETERDIYREHDEDGAPEYILDAIAALEALAQPEQEPVASIFISGIGEREFDDWGIGLPMGRNILYTTPPQRKPLTDEQIFEISNEFVLCMFPVETRTTDRELAFARAIEKAVTRQPQIRPLTDDVMWKLWNAEGNDEMNQQEAIAFARAIEAAHGIKE